MVGKGPATVPGDGAFVFVDGRWNAQQSYVGDRVLARFFEEIRTSKRLLGAVVAGHDRVIFPPRRYCEVTYRETADLVPVGPGGVIRAATRVSIKLPGAPTPPYVVAFVQLDGASTASPAYLRGEAANAVDPVALVGRRCRVVFRAQCAGDWSDFWYELDEEQSGAAPAR